MLAAPLLVLSLLAPHAQTPAAATATATPSANNALPAEIVPRDWLVIGALDRTGRRPFNPSTVFARHLLDPASPAPRADDALKGETGEERKWTALAAREDGTVEGEISCAYTAIESPSARVVMAELRGASRVYVNGAGFSGDVYGYGFRGVPVALRAGRNDVYVTGLRGAFRLRFWTPGARIVVGDWDLTRPDLVSGKPASLQHASILVCNASLETVAVALGAGGAAAQADHLFQHGIDPGPLLPPLCVDKARIEMMLDKSVPKEPGTVRFPLVVDGREHPFELTITTPESARRMTFMSRVDASVQECALLPSLEPNERFVLTLHGAGVDALDQVRAYGRERDFTFVAPTNRRPFGFDWQDWGRANAYEALDAAVAPRRARDVSVYLTGHSMGGHGTWHLAAHDPDRFLALAPSAGWSGFDAYGGGERGGELARWWRGADGASDTLAQARDLAPLPVLILHGEKDDNVPLGEAQRMEKVLRENGGEPKLVVQPGAGHWWDGDAARGVDCVDWPGIFELFRATKNPKATARLRGRSVDPGVRSRIGWMDVLQPLVYGEPIEVEAQLDEQLRTLSLTTRNLRLFRFGTPPPEWRPGALVIDGQRFELKAWDFAQSFARLGDTWTSANGRVRTSAQKSPELGGPFKRAFDRGFVLVYGTAGDEREDAELLARARCDAENWWYRGNGSARIVSDVEFNSRKEADWIFGMELGDFVPNVILYGNADTNAAWTPLWSASQSPFDAHRGVLRLGEREWKGDDLGALVVAPRRDKNGDVIALLGAFADSGARGSRLGYALQPFTSGVGYPDYTLFDARILTSGDGGVLATGYFDAEWKLDGRGFARAAGTKQQAR